MALFIPITKVDVAKKLVYGTLSEEVPDKAGEILDYETAKPAFETWSGEFTKASRGKSKGNVRAMHGTKAIGKFTDIAFDDDNKRIMGVAKIVDDAEWNKVLEGVYTGFSIGGGYAKRWQDTENPSLMRYTPVLSEVSLVDNPAVPTATFEIVKSDGTSEARKFNNMEATHDDTDLTPDGDDAEPGKHLPEDLDWLAGNVKDTKILKHIKALQAYLAGAGAEDDEEVTKLAKVNAGLQSEIATLTKRIAVLEAMPLPPKGILRAVSKSEDRLHQVEEQETKKTASVHDLMKLALSQPVVL